MRTYHLMPPTALLAAAVLVTATPTGAAAISSTDPVTTGAVTRVAPTAPGPPAPAPPGAPPTPPAPPAPTASPAAPQADRAAGTGAGRQAATPIGGELL